MKTGIDVYAPSYTMIRTVVGFVGIDVDTFSPVPAALPPQPTTPHAIKPAATRVATLTRPRVLNQFIRPPSLRSGLLGDEVAAGRVHPERLAGQHEHGRQ